ncbi:uncharacterized protein LOC126724565 [Quercus robur]|uniref:uncharacterized protein LOC126724565 n=1 Tax=Quercus robur TaxID=38942 RepID=UPI002163FA76|nr:uncharacterized protein LOC126724565 [Quercus robur]
MKFPNSKVFREALRKYAIKKPVDFKFKLNEKKISVYCINECRWRCYASQLFGELTFEIKTFNPECTCPRSFKHSQVTSSYVTKKFMQKFDKNPNWKVAGVQHHVKQALEIDISYSQVYRAKKKVIDLITRDEQLQYEKLRDYAEMIRLNDKGSRVILQIEMEDENAQPKFKIMYIKYNAQKVGFLGGCRLIIGLDGCHLKGRFGGQILFAIARNANDNIFPVAFAVVEQKNNDSWVWFLQQFSDDIGNSGQLNLVFITDRQKPSASVSTSDVPSQGSGGGVARGFKGRKCALTQQFLFHVPYIFHLWARQIDIRIGNTGNGNENGYKMNYVISSTCVYDPIRGIES